MAASIQLRRVQSIHPLPAAPSSTPPKSLSSFLAVFPSSPYSPALFHRSATLRSSTPAKHRRKGFRPSTAATSLAVAALGKLSEAELVPVPAAPEGMDGVFPNGSGVYAIYGTGGDLQFVGISRNVAASIATHRKLVPDLCCSVKVGLVDGAAPDRTILTDAWKSWMEEHIAATGRVPPGNESGNSTWVRRPQKKPDLRLTPGRHVQLTVPLEELIDRLVKENKVVAFIKGSRSAPQCGFSQKVVGILESHGADFESVDVLDEECNPGLRETLKRYSNWPTFPQVFVGGELMGGCDIISSMEEKGELAKLFQK